jgi:tetratricopeptide (TPR) repeat protein
MGTSALAGVVMACSAAAGLPAAAAVDVDALWDYQQPALSEQRFRDALAAARGDDALVLQTQIARTFSLRGRFDDAHQVLDALAPGLADAGPEPRVRALLERGRTLRSAGQAPAARPVFEQAVELAKGSGLTVLYADALHMVALVAPSLQEQLAWNRRVIDVARDSDDPRLVRWQGAALNNMGVSLREAGQSAEALPLFEQAVAAYDRAGRPFQRHVARWQVANTLRLLGRIDDALVLQQSLLAALEASGQTDEYVLEELATLHDARGEVVHAQQMRDRLQALRLPDKAQR